jgi:hypothetical protein
VADDLDDLELTPDEERKFGALFDREMDRRRAAAKRREAPKDFGDMMDRFREEIVDVLESDFGMTRSERDGDQPPARERSSSGGGGGGGDGDPTWFDKFMGNTDKSSKGRRAS